jgi:hypothetical protein
MKSHQKNTFSTLVNRKLNESQSNNKNETQPLSFNINNQRNQVSHAESNQRRASKKSSITALRKNDNTRVFKKREYSQMFSSYEKTQKEISSTMIRERRDAGLCTHCEKKNHDAKFCVDRVNTTVAVAPL